MEGSALGCEKREFWVGRVGRKQEEGTWQGGKERPTERVN
jgi:hypothetical protein